MSTYLENWIIQRWLERVVEARQKEFAAWEHLLLHGNGCEPPEMGVIQAPCEAVRSDPCD